MALWSFVLSSLGTWLITQRLSFHICWKSLMDMVCHTLSTLTPRVRLTGKIHDWQASHLFGPYRVTFLLSVYLRPPPYHCTQHYESIVTATEFHSVHGKFQVVLLALSRWTNSHFRTLYISAVIQYVSVVRSDHEVAACWRLKQWKILHHQPEQWVALPLRIKG